MMGGGEVEDKVKVERVVGFRFHFVSAELRLRLVSGCRCLMLRFAARLTLRCLTLRVVSGFIMSEAQRIEVSYNRFLILLRGSR